MNKLQFNCNRYARCLLFLSLIALGWMLARSHLRAATVTWSGAGGDELWSNPANWTGGMVPTPDDDVLIDVPGDTTVRMDAQAVTIRSLQCEEALFLENRSSFTVTDGESVINGAFGMAAGQSLVAAGVSTVFTVNGAVTNLWGLQAVGGAVLAFPTARQLAIGPSRLNVRWHANGQDSAILLANLTNVIIEPGEFLDLNAGDGGHIDVHQLLVPDGTLYVTAQNPDSVVDLSGFSGLWASGLNSGLHSFLSAGNEGTVLIPNVTALDRVDVYLSDSANVNIAQLGSYTDGWLYLASRTNGFNSLTNFNASIEAYSTRLDWTNLTVLRATNSFLSVNAYQGSVIDLSQVTNVVVDIYYQFAVNAGSGSRIDLQRMRVPEGSLRVAANDADSWVDLSGLNGEWATPGSIYGPSGVTARNGATVLISNVTAMRYLDLDFRGDAVVPTTQLRSLTEGSITLYGRTNGFEGLTNFSGYISVDGGTRLDLTNFTVLNAASYPLALYASGGSHIDLSRLTNVVVDAGPGLTAQAAGGSTIDLSGLLLPDGYVSATANGSGSSIDFSGFSGIWRGGYALASDSGTLFMPNVTELDGVNLSVSDSANVNLMQLTSITASSVTLTGRTNDFSSLTNFSGTLVAHATWLDLTNLTVLYVTNSHLGFDAYQGSVIDLSNVTNAVCSGQYGIYATVGSGARIDLRRLQVPDEGCYLSVNANGADSFVDLSGFNGLWHGSGTVFAGSGATVAISNVTAMRGINLDLRDDSIVPTAQLRSFNEGSIQLSARTNVFTELTNFTGAFHCNYLAHAAFPSLTQLEATNYFISLNAAFDSVIDLSRVTNAVVDFGNSLFLNAATAGRVELPHMETIVAGHVTVRAIGEGAVVDLSGLTGFFSDNDLGSLHTSGGGAVLLNSDAMLLAGVAIDFQGGLGGVLPPFLAPSRSLVLYGQPWQSYRIESRNLSEAGSPWTLYKRVPLTEALELIGPRPPQDQALRVYAFIANPPEVAIRAPESASNQVILFGVPEQTYRIESTTSLAPPIDWQNGPDTTLTNSFFIFPSASITNNARFYRAREL